MPALLPAKSMDHQAVLDNHNFIAMKKKIITLLLGSFAITGLVKAQTESPDTTARSFLIQASIANLQEIASGKLAAQRASDPKVKDFANMMITDHSKTQVKILDVAKNSGIQLPMAATETPVPDRTLKVASDQDFDRLYVHTMVPGHRETVQLFEKYAITGKNPKVKAFAQQTLPTLKEHLSMIKMIDSQLKNPAAK